jgi:DNA-binding ferritin-like protein
MTKKRRNGGAQTRKNMPSSKSSILRNFQREITVQFFEMLLLIKLFHWKTHSYATHKATDDLYSKFNEHMDKFIEVLLGKSGMRIDLMNKKQISLYDLNNQDELVSKVNLFKSYLVDLTNNKAMKIMSNTDLLNIRDEILGDMNQFLYLLSFK